MQRWTLGFLSLKQPIAFWNNKLFAFPFRKELHVAIVTSSIYNSSLQEDCRGNSLIHKSFYENPYDNRVDTDLLFVWVRTPPFLLIIFKFSKEKISDCPPCFRASKLGALMGTIVQILYLAKQSATSSLIHTPSSQF